MDLVQAKPTEVAVARARGLINRGNRLRGLGNPGVADSLRCYEEAARMLEALGSGETSPCRDDLASAWTNRGIALQHEGSPAGTEEAVACFDRAIGLRAPLVASGNPWFRYNLMGVWINRGDAQARLGGPERTADSIACYERALRLADGLVLRLRPEFPRRVALAHLNRGAVVLRQPGPEKLLEACRSYDSALSALGPVGPSLSADDRLIAASCWQGKADALEKGGSAAEARACAREALALVAGRECGHGDAAVIGIKARLVLCADACRGLCRGGRPQPREKEIAEAIEAVEDGLRLARQWEAEEAFQPLIRELFRFGTQAYAISQPHFLAEFIAEFRPLAGHGLEGEMRVIAAQALALAMGRVAAQGISSVGLRPIDETMATFRGLRQAGEQLGPPSGLSATRRSS